MGWCRVAIFVALLLARGGSGIAAPSYDWPLKANPVLTSSFGEPRSTHVHAGIDLSTGGRTGIACRAVADGSVVRMRMSPFGYGKALYVQIDSGPLVVYAHLSRFAEPMAQRAWQEQVRRGQYTFDIYLPPGSLRVRQGEIVAWSGDTGVGWPHLHFEVRDGDVARNPQTAGFALPDPVPPSIQAVEIVPLDPKAHVEGELDPWVSTAPSETHPVRVGGRVAFALRAIDRAGPGSYRQVPYRYEIRIDGRPLFRAEHERFDYAVNHHIVLDYDQEQLQQHEARFFWLHLRQGNELPGREAFTSGRGLVVAGIAEAKGLEDPSLLAPGKHEVEIEVADVAGHRRQLRFPLWASEKPQIAHFGGELRNDSLFVQCQAHDADGDSLVAALAFSRDGGSTWTDFTGREVSSPSGRPGWTWEAKIPWRADRPVALRALVEDPSGLHALATCQVGEPPSAPSPLDLQLTSRWRYGRLEVELQSAALLAGPPLLHLQGEHGSQGTIPPEQIGASRYLWAMDVEDLSDFEAIQVKASTANRVESASIDAPVRLVRRGHARHIEDLHPLVRLDFDDDTLFETIGLRITDVDPQKLRPGPELEPAGPCVRIEPRTAALDGRLHLRVQLPDTELAAQAQASRPGLFIVNGGGGLSYLGSDRSQDGELLAETRRLGTFIVLRDTKPPVLRDFRSVLRRGRPPRLEFVVHDGGADLSDTGIRSRIDAAVAIPEWDPETGRVLVHPTEDLSSGIHRLHVEAEDQLGNRSERTWEFEVP